MHCQTHEYNQGSFQSQEEQTASILMILALQTVTISSVLNRTLNITGSSSLFETEMQQHSEKRFSKSGEGIKMDAQVPLLLCENTGPSFISIMLQQSVGEVHTASMGDEQGTTSGWERTQLAYGSPNRFNLSVSIKKRVQNTVNLLSSKKKKKKLNNELLGKGIAFFIYLYTYKYILTVYVTETCHHSHCFYSSYEFIFSKSKLCCSPSLW